MNIFELTHKKLTEELSQRYGKGEYHSTALYREIIKNGNIEFENAAEFQKSKRLAEKIHRDITLPVPVISKKISTDKTIKFLCEFEDGLSSESVIIPMKNHNTLCISSQIGCKLGCVFCETGKMGFKRDLTVAEIVSQVYCARFVLKTNIKNLVFMGMGEPFDNFDNVRAAIDVLSDQRGFDFAHRHITVSTAGLVSGIKKLGQLNYKNINLAVSLNAPNDKIRSTLMPINKKYPMKFLQKALQDYPLKKRGSFFIEYVLIRGINDSQQHAKEIACYLKGIKVRLNLIPMNQTSCLDIESTTDEEIHRFAYLLEQEGMFVVKRWSRGESLFAACGQLGKQPLKKSQPAV